MVEEFWKESDYWKQAELERQGNKPEILYISMPTDTSISWAHERLCVGCGREHKCCEC